MIRLIWISGFGIVIVSIGFNLSNVLVWATENKEWFFSGIGVAVITSVITLGYQIYRDRKQDKKPAEPPSTINIGQITNYRVFPGVGVIVVITIILIVFDFSSPPPEPPSTTNIGQITANDGAVNVTGKGDIHSVVHNYGISETRFEQLVSELSVTKHVLSSFLKILEEKQVPPENWDKTLHEIANRHKELIAKLKTLNSEDPEVNKFRAQAEQAVENASYEEAEQFLNQAFALDEQAIQQMQENLYKRQVSAAGTLAATGQLKLTRLAYREAGEYYEQATALLPAKEEETLAYYSNQAGSALHEAALYDRAKPLYERALAIVEKVYGAEHPLVALSLNDLARLHQAQGHYETAELLFEQALAIQERVLGAEHPFVATILNNLAALHQDQGHYETAKPLYERALAIQERVLGAEHPNVASSLNNLAGLHQAQGHYETAKPLYERALAIFEKIYGAEHPLFATSLGNLAGLHQAQGHYETAKPLYERALAIFEKVYGAEHPLVAASLGNLAGLHQAQGHYETVKPLYERALTIFEKVYGAEHPDVAVSLNKLALLHYDQGDYETAKPLLERALAIFEKVYGAEHPNIANSLNKLALLHYDQGDYETAKPLLERAIKIANKFFEPNHPDVILYTENYNILLKEMQNKQE